MMTMGAKSHAILNGMLYDNFEVIELQANFIVDHAKPSNDMKLIKQALSPSDMQRFKEIDFSVHSLAEEIIEAARSKDMTAVSRAYAEMTTSCIACHTTFRDYLRPILHPTNK